MDNTLRRNSLLTMNSRRATPTLKRNPQESASATTNRASISKSQNATLMELRAPRSARTLYAQDSQTHLNLTGIPNISIAPKLLSHGVPDDYHELQCDLAHSYYLQALMKQEIVSDSITQHRDDLNVQLSVQRDFLYKSKLKVRQMKNDLVELQQVRMYDQFLEQLEKHVEEFTKLCDNLDMNNTMKHLVSVLDTCCSKLIVWNVNTITDTEDFIQLEVVIKRCASLIDGVLKSEQNKCLIDSLSDVICKLNKLLTAIQQKRVSLNNLQFNHVHNIFKALSELFAKKYDNEC